AGPGKLAPTFRGACERAHLHALRYQGANEMTTDEARSTRYQCDASSLTIHRRELLGGGQVARRGDNLTRRPGCHSLVLRPHLAQYAHRAAPLLARHRRTRAGAERLIKGTDQRVDALG